MLHVDPEQKRSRVLYGTIKKLKDEYTHLNSKISIASKVHDSDYVSSNVKAMKSFVKQKSTVGSATEVETFYTLFSQSDGSDEPPGTPTRQIHKVKMKKNSLYKPTVSKNFDKAGAKVFRHN